MRHHHHHRNRCARYDSQNVVVTRGWHESPSGEGSSCVRTKGEQRLNVCTCDIATKPLPASSSSVILAIKSISTGFWLRLMESERAEVLKSIPRMISLYDGKWATFGRCLYVWVVRGKGRKLKWIVVCMSLYWCLERGVLKIIFFHFF